MKRITRFRHKPEETAMIAFFDYCRAMSHVHRGYSLAFHIPNESKSSIQRRMTMKRAGVKKGIPDICIPIPNDKFASLYIEMKIKPNKPSPEQMQVIRELNQAGNYACLCWSADEAIEMLTKYLNNKL
tara:strand:+ start:368 stop:751 length:384 start_codon:yes stop_codon:yes gene_type:complete